MKISNDLKHVLENVHNGNKNIILRNGIPFNYICSTDVFNIIKVIKKGRIWKMVDEWSNEYTISTLNNEWQYALYMNLLSMEDNRYKPVNYKLTLNFIV